MSEQLTPEEIRDSEDTGLTAGAVRNPDWRPLVHLGGSVDRVAACGLSTRAHNPHGAVASINDAAINCPACRKLLDEPNRAPLPAYKTVTCGRPWVAEIQRCPRCGQDALAHAVTTTKE